MLGEPIIAGKTEDEILAMKRWTRSRWYKTILPEEKEEAMKGVNIAMRTKLSAAWTSERKASHNELFSGENNPMFGKTHTEESKIKNRMAHIGKTLSKEHKAKLSERMTGENHPLYGKLHSEEHKAKISAAMTGRTLSEEHKAKISTAWTPEKRAKSSAARIGKYTGENGGNWRGGISFEPYCSKFNNQLKESIRNCDNRTCVLCGTSEIQNGQRLSVHHIDSNKAQGCSGVPWYLCALCRSCNSRLDTVEKEFLIVSNSKPRRNEHEPTF